MTSVFEKYKAKAFPFRYEGELHLTSIAGGTPSDPKVAEGFLRSKFKESDETIRAMTMELMLERGIEGDEALKAVEELRYLNGFKRDDGGLYVEGRQLKAAVKEAASIAAAAEKIKKRGWANIPQKGVKSFLAEHFFVVEDRLHLREVPEPRRIAFVKEPTGIYQHFPSVNMGKGRAIAYEEYCEDVSLTFTVITDMELSEQDWAMIWLTGGEQGLGALRSQGFGRYQVTKWDQVGGQK